jgi:4,5-DOPA dioxygenase extradiol
VDRITFLKSLGFLSMNTSLDTLGQLRTFTEGLPLSDKMPVLFLGHGSPMNAIEDNIFVKAFQELGNSIPTPKAIICVSAHWFTNGTMVTAMDFPSTIHDFGGFPKELYEVQYNAKGERELAKTTKEILKPIEVKLDYDWGLDHGAWSVLKHLYPKADIPVIQLSIDYRKGPEYHFELAQKLKNLREKGVLIVGSGNIVHNLGLLDFPNLNKENYGFDWALESKNKINDWIIDGDLKSLIDYRNKGRAINLSIPTPEHFLPLIYALGLKQKSDSISIFNDQMVGGSISMTSLKII